MSVCLKLTFTLTKNTHFNKAFSHFYVAALNYVGKTTVVFNTDNTQLEWFNGFR